MQVPEQEVGFKPLLDDAGKASVLQKENGKPVLKKSYSVPARRFLQLYAQCRVHGCESAVSAALKNT